MVWPIAVTSVESSASSSSVRDALIGGLLGSVLAIAAQWFLGPGIERRVRAQERWEEFLIELASLLHGPVKQAQSSARSAWTSWHLLQQLAKQPNVDQAKISEFNRRDKETFKEALNAWSDALTRPEWLAKRLTGNYGLAGPDMRRFYSKWLRYSVWTMQWASWENHPKEDPERWDQAQASYKSLVDEVEKLSERIGVPMSLLGRIKASLRLKLERSRSRKAKEAAATQEPPAVSDADSNAGEQP